MSLLNKKVGFEGPILGLAGDAVVLQRLRELGFISGETVRIKSKTLFGCPLIVQVQGVTVALRKEEAKCVQI